jgi:hypothetical protein
VITSCLFTSEAPLHSEAPRGQVKGATKLT